MKWQYMQDQINYNTAMANHDDDAHPADGNTGLVVEEAKPEIKRPSMYKVILINDDYTPMEFVVHILEYYFGMDREAATRIMLSVHTTGKGLCGVFTRDVAETKVAQVNDYSRQHEHPLMCSMEADS